MFDAILTHEYIKVWDVCEELQTFIQDSKEVLWSEVRHISGIAKAFVESAYILALESFFDHLILVERGPTATHDPNFSMCEPAESTLHVVLNPR